MVALKVPLREAKKAPVFSTNWRLEAVKFWVDEFLVELFREGNLRD